MMKTKLAFFTVLLLTVQITAQTWRNIGPGGGSDLQSIAVHPNNPDIVYLGGDIEGLFKTTDGGLSWESINNNLATGPWTPDVYWTNQIKFDLTDNSHNSLFLCTAVALFYTTNGGNSWQKLFPSEILSEDDFANVYSVGQNPNNTNELILGTTGKGLYQSSDKGGNWIKIALPMNDTATVYASEFSSDGNIYLASNDGFYFSDDDGINWQSRNNGLPHKFIWNMKVVESNSDKTLFVSLVTFGNNGNPGSFKGGIYKSTDEGMNWIDINGNLPRMQSDGLFYYYWKFTVNPFEPATIYIGTSVGYPDETLAAFEEWGIYKTNDGGNEWNKIDTNVTEGWMDQSFFDERHALVLSITPADTNRIYWGRDWIYKTTNAGNSWEQIYTQKIGNAWKGNGFELMMTEGIAFSPTDPNKIFVGYDDMGPFRSTDGGVSFKPLDPQMDPYDGYDAAKDIFIDPENGDIYMSRYDGIGSAFTNGYTMGRIYKSTNDGETFVNISNGFSDGRPDLIADFSSGSAGNRTLYATSFSNGVYKSTNSGISWTAINNGLGVDAAGAWKIKMNPNNNTELFLGINNFGGGGALYKSTNAGNSWVKLSSFPAFDILSIEFDKQNNIIYCGATENYDWSIAGGLYKSTNGGSSWEQISDLPRIADIVVNPDDPDMLIIVSQPWYAVWLPDVQPGIFRSTDAGSTWQNITNNLNHVYVLFADINPNNTSQLFVGTGGGGLWVSDNFTIISDETDQMPNKYYLYQNYPNPFNPNTKIKFIIPSVGTSLMKFVQLEVYNILGNKVATLVNEEKPTGEYEVEFDGSALPSGIYFYRITSGSYSETKKMILLR